MTFPKIEIPTSVPNDALPLVILSWLIVAGLVAALIRIFLLKRLRRRLRKNISQLETQIQEQHEQMQELRQSSTVARDGIMQQFSEFRIRSAEDLVRAEISVRSRLSSTAPAKTVPALAAETSKSTELAPPASSPVESSPPSLPLLLPALEASSTETPAEKAPLPTIPAVQEQERVTELEARLAEAAQHNDNLQKALLASRQRQTRAKARPTSRLPRGRQSSSRY